MATVLGDPALKAVLQWIAASAEGRAVVAEALAALGEPQAHGRG